MCNLITIIFILVTIIGLVLAGSKYSPLIISIAALGLAISKYNADTEYFDDEVVTTETKQDESQFKKDWDNSASVALMFQNSTSDSEVATTVTDGDELIYDAMKNVSDKNLEAILNRSRMSADTGRKFFQEELDEQEKRHWWENDSLDSQCVKDEQQW